MIRKGIAGSLLLVFAAIISFAQEFTAAASSKKIGIEDQVRVTYNISDMNSIEGFERPAFAGFVVVGTQQSINMGASFSLSYILEPVKKGVISIPPARAKVNGKIINSNPVSIEVVDGSLAPKRPAAAQRQRTVSPWGDDDPFEDMNRAMARMMEDNDRAMEEMMRQRQRMIEEYMRRQGGSPYRQLTEEEIARNIFIKVDVDKTSAFVGEQITASYKLCTRLGFESAMVSKLPTLSGFWAQDFDIPFPPKAKLENINGLPYNVMLLKKTALFPTQSGVLELDPAKIDCNTQVGTLHLSSPVVKITVKPLPVDNQPPGFTGAVGNFTADARVSRKDCTTDDVATLTFTISGSGNLKLIDNPVIDFPKELGVYDPEVTDTITGRSPAITGKKIFTYNFNPQMPGTYAIPPINFTYFDANAKTYKTVTTPSFEINVKEGKSYRQNLALDKKLPRDIHDIIKNDQQFEAPPGKPWAGKAWYWSVYSLPVLSFIGLLAWRKRREEWEQNAALFKNRKANKVAWKRLAMARKLLSEKEHTQFYEEISKAIWLYLSDKLSVPISELSKENITAELSLKNVPPEHIDATRNLITECEMALYSPSGGKQQKAQTLNEATSIITRLEDTLKQQS